MTAGAAYAQLPGRSGGSTGLDSQGVPYSSKYWKGAPEQSTISLVRKPGLTENQFALRIASPFLVNGCMKLSNFGYMAEFKDGYLDISIEDMTVDMRDQPQYAHYECSQKAQMPMADIVLNRDDLVKNQTQVIRMHNGSDTNYYNITLTDDNVMILPDESYGGMIKRFIPQALPGRKTTLTYWFYPVGTILLWVPGMDDTQKSVEALRAFAKEKGLAPLETVMPAFESPMTKAEYQYFIDTDGTFDDNQDELVDGMAIGDVSFEKTVYGLEKDETVLDKKTVYAKRPGMYE